MLRPLELIVLGRDQGLQGLTAEVLSDNQPMIKVFEKTRLPMESRLDSGVYHLKLSFSG